MREKNAPAIAKPLMEADGTFTGILFKIGSGIAQTYTHAITSFCGSISSIVDDALYSGFSI
jgi:hypothetical protein